MAELTETMAALTAGLPPEIVAQLNPRMLANEREYWEARERLVATHAGRWIGFAGGKVVAEGASPVAVAHAAGAVDRQAWVTRVGHESDPIRIRESKRHPVFQKTPGVLLRGT